MNFGWRSSHEEGVPSHKTVQSDNCYSNINNRRVEKLSLVSSPTEKVHYFSCFAESQKQHFQWHRNIGWWISPTHLRHVIVPSVMSYRNISPTIYKWNLLVNGRKLHFEVMDAHERTRKIAFRSRIHEISLMVFS